MVVGNNMPRVVVVEDEAIFRESITLALRLEGYDVRSADNGAQGLITIQNFLPDLVILDLSLPQMDGWQVLHRIRQDPALWSTRVLVLTASADELTRLRSEAEQANLLLVKPVSLDEIFNALQVMLD